MSRIGRKAITLPKGVDVTVNGQHVTVKGAKAPSRWMSCRTSPSPSLTVQFPSRAQTTTRPSAPPTA